jgi:dTDP-glucose 4,6-dehydratase
MMDGGTKEKPLRLLVTGGAGFIGSNFIRHMLAAHDRITIVNLDALTYAGNLNNLKAIEKDPRYSFLEGDICDPGMVDSVLAGTDAVVHFAAETHVDRSIQDPSAFVRTNILGTQVLLECAKKNRTGLFIHVSTDEVYGSTENRSFSEHDPLHPSSPYAASKAGSDLLALSYHTTYDLPVMVTRCTNNFGPFQFPEKLIPLFITNLLNNEKVPVYGTGENIRDWIHVRDHCSAIDFLLDRGTPGEIYNIGGGNEKTNLEITHKILDQLGKSGSLIEYVQDRQGHDFRYSLDCTKIKTLGWTPSYSFEDALHDTISWYRNNAWWWQPLRK